jgi:hypothetical protein
MFVCGDEVHGEGRVRSCFAEEKTSCGEERMMNIMCVCVVCVCEKLSAVFRIQRRIEEESNEIQQCSQQNARIGRFVHLARLR